MLDTLKVLYEVDFNFEFNKEYKLSLTVDNKKIIDIVIVIKFIIKYFYKNSYIFSKMPRRIFAFSLSLLSPCKNLQTFKSTLCNYK